MTDEAAQGAAIVSQILSNWIPLTVYIRALRLTRQTPHNPFGLCILPQNHGLLERRGRGSALTICLPECGESSKGATARAWLGCAQLLFPPRGLQVFS